MRNYKITNVKNVRKLSYVIYKLIGGGGGVNKIFNILQDNLDICI